MAVLYSGIPIITKANSAGEEKQKNTDSSVINFTAHFTVPICMMSYYSSDLSPDVLPVISGVPQGSVL